jgi:hypothetical protein
MRKVKMVKVIVLLQNSLNEHRAAWRAAGALALGVLLGVLVAMPYDRALGASALPYTAHLYTALQSLVAAATLVRVRAANRAELEIDVHALTPQI